MNADPIIDGNLRTARDTRSVAPGIAVVALLVICPLGLALLAQQPPASGTAPTDAEKKDEGIPVTNALVRQKCSGCHHAAAGIDEFISKLPAGKGTVVGERGSALSAGERQRIALARACC